MTKTSEDRKADMTGWRIAAWVGAGLILLLPLVAMRFTREVNWTAFDFLVAAVMLGGLVGAFELVVRLSRDWFYRAAVVVAAGAIFLMVWIQGAVGLVGSENDLFNLIFLAPVAIGAAGCLIVGFKPKGMSRVLMAMALIQAATVVIGYAMTRDADAFLLAFWVFAWALSGWLFSRAQGSATRS